MYLSGPEGSMEFLKWVGEMILSLAMGGLGVAFVAIVTIYIGGRLHKKLPEKDHQFGSLLLVVGTTLITSMVAIALGGTTETWASLVLGLCLGVYYFEKV